jgi:hypothetical protein
VAIDVGEVVATLRADTKQFEQAMGKSNTSMLALGAGSVAMGNIASQAFNHILAGAMSATSAIVRWAGEASAAAEHTRILSMQLGIADHTLEAWGMAATHAGGSIETLSSGMRTLSRHLEGLGSGAEQSVELFNKLGSGMTVVEMAGMSTEQSIRLVADRFANMSDGAEKSKMAIDLFGRSGLQLLPILNQGSAGLDKAAKEAADFGIALTDTQRNALDRYDTAVDKMSSALQGFKNQVAAAFAPSLTKNVEWMTSAVSYAKSIFTGFADAAEKLFVRFGAMSAAIQIMGQQLFSMSVFNKEAWLQTLDQVKAVDAWAEAQIKAIDTGKNAEVQMGANITKTKEYTVSQVKLGEAIVAATKIQVKQLEELKERAMQAMADDFAKGDRQQESLNDKIKDNMILYTARKEADEKFFQESIENNMLLYQSKKEFEEKQRTDAIEANMMLYQASKEALEKKTQDEIEATMLVYRERRNLELEEEAAQGKAQQALGQFIVKKEQARQAMQFGWADVFGEVSQSAQFAFGQIKFAFGNTVVGLMQGTATWADFWKSAQGSILNSAVQFGIDIVAQFLMKNAAILATEMATATAMTGIWTSTAAFVTGTFGALTGAIMGFFTATIIPFFASIGTMLMSFLSAIAAAASATIFGIPYGVAILAGVAIIGAAIGSLYAFHAFADGGVVTKPTLGLVGEAGPEAIIPLDQLGQMGGGGETTVVIELDGRQMAKSVFDNMTSVTRMRMGRA